MYIYSISFNSVLKKAKSDVFLSSSEREREMTETARGDKSRDSRGCTCQLHVSSRDS